MYTKFKAKYLQQYATEIFGTQQFQSPLLTKNLSQKTKFQLKQLGNKLIDQNKQITEQVRELYDKYSHEVKDDKGQISKEIREEDKDIFLKETQELDEMDLNIEHYAFKESDFIDNKTNEIVGGEEYFNILDLLIFEKTPAPITENGTMQVA